MELTVIYNLLQKAQNIDEFMIYNNLIFLLNQENELVNSRNCDKIEASNKVRIKNKILSFINQKTK